MSFRGRCLGPQSLVFCLESGLRPAGALLPGPKRLRPKHRLKIGPGRTLISFSRVTSRNLAPRPGRQYSFQEPPEGGRRTGQVRPPGPPHQRGAENPRSPGHANMPRMGPQSASAAWGWRHTTSFDPTQTARPSPCCDTVLIHHAWCRGCGLGKYPPAPVRPVGPGGAGPMLHVFLSSRTVPATAAPRRGGRRGCPAR